MKELGKLPGILKELRQSFYFTQAFVATKLGISHQSYQAYESGKAVPTIENFIGLANLYDVSLDYLIGRTNI